MQVLDELRVGQTLVDGVGQQLLEAGQVDAVGAGAAQRLAQLRRPLVERLHLQNPK